MSQVQINNNINSVGVENQINTVNVGIDDNIIIVPQDIVTVIEIATPGPQGPPGQNADAFTGSFVTTASFDAFTSSYYLDSSSFNARIDAVSTSSLIFDSLENYLPIFNSNNSISSSNIYVTESKVAINTTTTNAALTVNTTASNVNAFEAQITGSTYFTVNNEGVVVLRPLSNTPTAVSGGLFYSASGDYFFGVF
jgi:hypothetical protein